MENSYLDIQIEKEKLRKELQTWFSSMRKHLESIPSSLDGQVSLLSRIRADVYEELNQIQHAAAIISVAEKLQTEFSEITKWFWHPKQTSDKDYADLTGLVGDQIFLNAEITTALAPKGSIDAHMSSTLTNLSVKKGKTFYFVQTDKMLARANTKIKKNNWNIEARKILIEKS